MDTCFGTKFRERRESLGFSVQDVSNVTKILTVYIEALENDDFSVLPQRVYAVGFVRCYSEMLGLDSDEMISTLLRNLSTTNKINKQLPNLHQETKFCAISVDDFKRNAKYIVAVLLIVCVAVFSKLVNGQ